MAVIQTQNYRFYVGMDQDTPVEPEHIEQLGLQGEMALTAIARLLGKGAFLSTHFAGTNSGGGVLTVGTGFAIVGDAGFETVRVRTTSKNLNLGAIGNGTHYIYVTLDADDDDPDEPEITSTMSATPGPNTLQVLSAVVSGGLITSISAFPAARINLEEMGGVKVSVGDRQAGYLNGKLLGSTNITLTVGSDNLNETLTIAIVGPIADGLLTESYIKANGTRAFTADQSFGGFKATNLAAPVGANDAARKAYVDDAIAAIAAPRWTKYTKTYLQLAAAALTNDIELFSLPAGHVIHAVKIKHSTAFAGGAIATYTVSVGIAGNLTKYAGTFDVFQAIGNTIQQLSSVVGTENHGAATSIRLAAVATGANLDQASSGSVDVWVLSSPAT